MSQNASGKPISVLIVRNAFGYDFGGAEKFAVSLALELSKYGYKPVLVTRSPQLLKHSIQSGISSKRGLWWSSQNWGGIRIALLPFYLAWQILLIIWYAQLMVRLRVHIVHPQSRDDFIAATVAGRMLGKRVVWTDHADLKYIFANHPAWYKNFVGKLVYLASKLAHHITLVSKSEQLLIEAALGKPLPPKYEVIYNGISDQPATPYPRPQEEQKAVVFCTTSRLVTAKGIGELITAFKLISSGSLDLRLWIVGTGPEASHFKELARNIPGIIFFGHSDSALSLVAASDIFVHPSYHEGFSLSLVEAAMLGKPIIACSVGGNKEIIQDSRNGLLVPPRDAEALAQAMLKLAREPETREIYGNAAREFYESNLVFETIVKDRFMPLYD